MYSYESLKGDIENLGILPTDTINIHSSLKSVGDIEGGGDTLLDVFCDYLHDDGLLVLPCHTWGNIEEFSFIFDPVKTPSNLGVLPNLFRVRKDVYRSLHPTHSVCAFGKNAQEFVTLRFPQLTPCNSDGCYGKLIDMGAKILLIGVTLTKNTFFHYIEETSAVGRPRWVANETLPTKIKLTTGEIMDSPLYTYNYDTSSQFDRAMDLVLGEKTTKTGKIGNADCILIDCRKIYPVIANLLKEQPDFFV